MAGCLSVYVTVLSSETKNKEHAKTDPGKEGGCRKSHSLQKIFPKNYTERFSFNIVDSKN